MGVLFCHIGERPWTKILYHREDQGQDFKILKNHFEEVLQAEARLNDEGSELKADDSGGADLFRL